ncbi:MAG: aminotransferase class III-fold pyridoxal phosphate-dependent enzyme [Candidatus Latescibacteria bacterium]|nr:aminotransferase class III-fold pyridoxal phosphate-dependent enzyme [Candidatus Latescibacterota bacterium]
MDSVGSINHVFHRSKKISWPRISHGKGCCLFDTDGNEYLDACAGVHVVSIGHGVEEIVQAMADQARKVCFAYGQFISQSQIDLAEKIAAMSPGALNRVFFVSGGSEATESAMKIARKYHVETGNPSKYQIISRWQSWHGNTVGALSMSGRSAWRKDYTPYLLDFPHISPHSTDELERVIKQVGAEYISAFIAEPIFGTSCAALAPPDDYFPKVREICDRYNILLIIDEVVTGFGRTGVNFGIDHWDVVPDIMATGKGLSSGYTPIAATVATDDIYDAIFESSPAFVHGHTYGGNPLSCATALAVQQYIEKHDLISRCAAMGDLLLQSLEALRELPMVSAVRGKGLLSGIDLSHGKEADSPFDPALGVTARVVNRAFDGGVLVMPGAPGPIDGVNGDHIAISPPFTVTETEISRIVHVLKNAIISVAEEIGE